MNLQFLKIALPLLFAGFVSFGCSNNESNSSDSRNLKTCSDLAGCQDCVIIDQELYDNTTTGNYTIREVRIFEDCLEIVVSASGCDGNTWAFELVDKGAVAESFPPQRWLRLGLENNELCEAYITKTISFNIKPLQTDSDVVLLHLEAWISEISYSY